MRIKITRVHQGQWSEHFLGETFVVHDLLANGTCFLADDPRFDNNPNVPHIVRPGEYEVVPNLTLLGRLRARVSFEKAPLDQLSDSTKSALLQVLGDQLWVWTAPVLPDRYQVGIRTDADAHTIAWANADTLDDAALGAIKDLSPRGGRE